MSRKAVWGGLAVLVVSLVSGCGQQGFAAHVEGQVTAGSTAAPATTSQTASSAEAQPSEQPKPATAIKTKPHAAPQGLSPAEQYSRARSVVEKLGFDPGNNPADWHADHQLNALSGSPTGSNGHPQRIFFFVNGDYIGTDASEGSQGLQLTGYTKNEVTVRYALFGPNDAMCCPTQFSTINFDWDGNQLTPDKPIPPVNDPNLHR